MNIRGKLAALAAVSAVSVFTSSAAFASPYDVCYVYYPDGGNYEVWGNADQPLCATMAQTYANMNQDYQVYLVNSYDENTNSYSDGNWVIVMPNGPMPGGEMPSRQ